MYSCCCVKNSELRRNKGCKAIFLVIRTVIGCNMKCIAPKSVMIKKIKHLLNKFYWISKTPRCSLFHTRKEFLKLEIDGTLNIFTKDRFCQNFLKSPTRVPIVIYTNRDILLT